MSITVSNYWGVIAIASVVFDIDVGQSLDMVYPEAVALSAEVKQSIAYLALPHSNKLVEGDTQFSFRVRRQDASLNADSCTSTDSDATSLSPSFYYGFVLFRQRKDATQSRGYFQKSMVVLTEVPFVGLYDRVLRIVGPLFFQVGNPLLQALYENFGQWPAPVANSTMALQVAGTVVTFVVPKTISYQDATLYTRRWSIDDESFDVELGDVVDEATDDDRVGATTDKTIIQNGKFCIVHSTDVSASEAVPPPLCFADWLNLNELGMSFEEFLAALGKRSLKLPFALRTTKAKVKMLYARFIASPHFQPWFNYRRNECIEAFDGMLHTLRGTISSQDLMREPSGIGMALPALYTLAAQVSDVPNYLCCLTSKCRRSTR
ncbi:hypothetical protein DYB32_001493 [Aphanomyces invadans]|uniref:UDENN domain-containing protein n=1 Tax=Aphanomyces invadans TaxID=157072 RepID=A0A3R6YEM5_9STRA|nr:hypothetical protein DYB32_001493 [Aphanomyces invadans]